MKKFKAFILLIVAIALPGRAFESGGISYTINSDSTSVTVARGAYAGLTNVNIPSSVSFEGKPYAVTGVADNAFSSCAGLKSISLPSSLKTIGGSAFNGCTSLTEFTIPSKVDSIGSYALAHCDALTKVTIGKALKCNLSYQLFYSTPALSTIIVESGNPRYDSRSNCNAIVETASNTLVVGCKGSTIPSTVTEIGGDAFYHVTSLTSINIPGTVKKINYEAFIGCENLQTVTIGNGVEHMGTWAFNGCKSLTSIAMPNSITSFGYGCFRSCSSLVSVTLPNNMTELPTYMFSYCTSLKNITLPSTLTYIGYESFEDCSSLENITIPPSVTEIDHYAFFNCTSLKSIYLPASVTKISVYDGYGLRNCFAGCTALSSIKVDSNNPVFDSRNNCNAIIRTADNTLMSGCKNTVIPNTVTTIGESAFYRMSSLTSLNIPSSVTKIDYIAFLGCSGLTSITIPNSVTTLKNNIFQECTNLKNVTLPGSITTINYQMFMNCSSLETINLGEGLTTIEADAFNGCASLKSVNLPTTLQTIGARAFRNSGLTSLTLPQARTLTINKEAFSYCNNLTTVTVPKNVTCPDGYSFTYCSSLTTVNYEGTKVFDGMFGYCSALTNLNFSDNVKTIGSYAFRNSGLQAITIGKNITGIYESAFSGCNGLTALQFEDSESNVGLGENAFAGCGFTTLTIPERVNCSKWSFYGCNKLSDVNYQGPSISQKLFDRCSSLRHLTIGKATKTISSDAFNDCPLESIVVDPENTKFDSRDNCNAVIQSSTLMLGSSKTVIPRTVKYINTNAFYGRKELTAIVIPDSVTRISGSAFYGCGLTSITFPASLKTIYSALNGCSALTTIICKMTDPTKMTYKYNSSDYFNLRSVNKDICTLWVPQGTAELYRTTDPWSTMTHIEEYQIGDLNLDQTVNTGDVSTLFSIIINNTQGIDADLNGDGDINAGDVSELYKIILGQ